MLRKKKLTKDGVVNNMLSSPEVITALDRINLSNGKFTMLAAATSKCNSTNTNSIKLSKSTVRRKRAEHRLNINQKIKSEFTSKKKTPLIVHWDGKLMKDSTNLITCNRKKKC